MNTTVSERNQDELKLHGAKITMYTVCCLNMATPLIRNVPKQLPMVMCQIVHSKDLEQITLTWYSGYNVSHRLLTLVNICDIYRVISLIQEVQNINCYYKYMINNLHVVQLTIQLHPPNIFFSNWKLFFKENQQKNKFIMMLNHKLWLSF